MKNSVILTTAFAIATAVTFAPSVSLAGSLVGAADATVVADDSAGLAGQGTGITTGQAVALGTLAVLALAAAAGGSSSSTTTNP